MLYQFSPLSIKLGQKDLVTRLFPFGHGGINPAGHGHPNPARSEEKPVFGLGGGGWGGHRREMGRGAVPWPVSVSLGWEYAA